MSKPDKNLYSFTGDEKGNIWLNELILFWGKDWVEGTRRTHTLDLRDVHVGNDIADTVKLSGALDLNVIIVGIIEGGYEDCIDINNECKRCTVSAPDGCTPRGRYFTTIKGGSEDIMISTWLMAYGDTTDVALGEHSDQSMKATKRVTLDITVIPGNTVGYWQFNATDPVRVVGSGPYHCEFRMWPWFRKPFAWIVVGLKKIGLPI
tara:strand:- start:1774 stop:2391 length:618 start_codon:yes stop_codon:yes gene_type:complete